MDDKAHRPGGRVAVEQSFLPARLLLPPAFCEREHGCHCSWVAPPSIPVVIGRPVEVLALPPIFYSAADPARRGCCGFPRPKSIPPCPKAPST